MDVKKLPDFVCGPNLVPRSVILPRLNPIDPSELDPRTAPPCVKNPCCVCRPCPYPAPPPCFNLKLKQLEDCYTCQVSDGCRRRKSNFYHRWQTYLDRLHNYPNYDYGTYCCDDYVDLGVNKDFDHYLYSRFKKDFLGQRQRARLNFLWPRLLGQSLGEQEMDRSTCASTEDCQCKCAHLCDWTDIREDLANRVRLYNEDGYSRWHQKQLAPFGFTETATLVKTRVHPFKKDTSFSAPLEELVTGREPPYKEIRDMKLAGVNPVYKLNVGQRSPCRDQKVLRH